MMIPWTSNPTKDRVSQLHNTFIYKILSHPPIEDAAPKTLLSKRWNIVWLVVPDLNFDGNGKNPTKFVITVFKVLLGREIQQSIRYLRLRHEDGIDPNYFMGVAVQRKLKFLDLNMLVNLNLFKLTKTLLKTIHLSKSSSRTLSPHINIQFFE